MYHVHFFQTKKVLKKENNDQHIDKGTAIWLLDHLFNFLQSEDPQTGYELPYKNQVSQSWLLAISFQAQG